MFRKRLLKDQAAGETTLVSLMRGIEKRKNILKNGPRGGQMGGYCVDRVFK